MNSEQFENFINQDFNSFSNWLFSLNAYEFSLIASVIGFIISPPLTTNQKNSLGNFFELLGQVILTIGAQESTLQSKENKSTTDDSSSEKKHFEEEILKIKEELSKLKKDY